MDWFFQLSESIRVSLLFLSIPSFFILTITILIFNINIIDWIVSIYLFYKKGWFQLSYPNFSDKIYEIEYTHYIVGETTGEIFYVDKKRLMKLKKYNKIKWNPVVNNYSYDDSEVEKIKEIISPLILRDQT